MPAIGGTAYIMVDGDQKSLKGSLVVSGSTVERTDVAGQDGPHGYIEMPRVPFISGVFSDTDGLSIEDLDRITNATITIELLNGKGYVLRNAWTKAAHELDTAQGQVPVRFGGLSCREIRV